MQRIENMLIEYPIILQKINDLRFEMTELLNNKNYYSDILKAQRYKELVVSHKKNNDSVFDAAAKAIDINRNVYKIKEKINELLAEKKDIELCLKSLDDIEFRLVNLRYFRMYNWRLVSLKLKISRTKCFYVKQRALAKIMYEMNEIRPYENFKIV